MEQYYQTLKKQRRLPVQTAMVTTDVTYDLLRAPSWHHLVLTLRAKNSNSQSVPEFIEQIRKRML